MNTNDRIEKLLNEISDIAHPEICETLQVAQAELAAWKREAMLTRLSMNEREKMLVEVAVRARAFISGLPPYIGNDVHLELTVALIAYDAVPEYVQKPLNIAPEPVELDRPLEEWDGPSWDENPGHYG